LGTDVILFSANVGGSVTEEGKRTCPLADRPILETRRLPSSVTSPQNFRLNKSLLYSRTLPLQELYRTGAVPPSPRGKAFVRMETLRIYLYLIEIVVTGLAPVRQQRQTVIDIWKRLVVRKTPDDAKAFSRGEGGALPALTVFYFISVGNR
jgi:hypothetical protein